jgi:hypothetical protein
MGLLVLDLGDSLFDVGMRLVGIFNAAARKDLPRFKWRFALLVFDV